MRFDSSYHRFDTIRRLCLCVLLCLLPAVGQGEWRDDLITALIEGTPFPVHEGDKGVIDGSHPELVWSGAKEQLSLSALAKVRYQPVSEANWNAAFELNVQEQGIRVGSDLLQGTTAAGGIFVRYSEATRHALVQTGRGLDILVAVPIQEDPRWTRAGLLCAVVREESRAVRPHLAIFSGEGRIRGSFQSGLRKGRAKAIFLPKFSMPTNLEQPDETETKDPVVEARYRPGQSEWLDMQNVERSGCLEGKLFFANPVGYERTLTGSDCMRVVPVSLGEDESTVRDVLGLKTEGSLSCIGIRRDLTEKISFTGTSGR